MLPEEGPLCEKTMKRINEIDATYGFESKLDTLPEFIKRHDLEWSAVKDLHLFLQVPVPAENGERFPKVSSKILRR